jgi:hypothetical protein
MAMGMFRAIDAELARLEAAAACAGCALACSYQSADEFHRALICDYLNAHAPRRIDFYVLTFGIFAALFICF